MLILHQERENTFDKGNRGGISNIIHTLANTIIPTTETWVLTILKKKRLKLFTRKRTIYMKAYVRMSILETGEALMTFTAAATRKV